jgi:hypothetical protein
MFLRYYVLLFLLLITFIFPAKVSANIKESIDSLISYVESQTDSYQAGLQVIDILEVRLFNRNMKSWVRNDQEKLVFATWKWLIEYVIEKYEWDLKFNEVVQIENSLFYIYPETKDVYTEMMCYWWMPCGLKNLSWVMEKDIEKVFGQVLVTKDAVYVWHRKQNLVGDMSTMFSQHPAKMYDRSGDLRRFVTNDVLSWRLCGWIYDVQNLCVTRLDPHDLDVVDYRYAKDKTSVYYTYKLTSFHALSFQLLKQEFMIDWKLYNIYEDKNGCYGHRIVWEWVVNENEGIIAFEQKYCELVK